MTLTAVQKRMAMREVIVQTLADEFEMSGIKYTCGAVVMDFARKQIIPLFERLKVPLEYQVQREWQMRKLERSAWNEVQRRYVARQKD